MIRISFAAPALLLALAACQPENEILANATNGSDAAPPAETPTPAPTDTPSPTPTPEPTGNASDGGEEGAEGTIPAAFHGRWGMVPADCTSTRGDAKGLLTIDADTLRFYESRGTLTEVIGDFPEKLVGRYSFVGEGQEWTKQITLELTGSSNTLIRTETDLPGRYTYTRCEG